jgi:hypothetical protein
MDHYLASRVLMALVSVMTMKKLVGNPKQVGVVELVQEVKPTLIDTHS